MQGVKIKKQCFRFWSGPMEVAISLPWPLPWLGPMGVMCYSMEALYSHFMVRAMEVVIPFRAPYHELILFH
uniref:Uncharacterized protein n=1 Tax=Physcomitrium patens TaxID=3218 RepID=A0A2K1KQM5_PHYPA|nr:hypothetical protein PHYPA_006999 [Physcomitrium patens]